MKRVFLLLAVMLLTWGCEEIDTGEAPTLAGGFEVTVVGQDQISVTWSPGNDDLLEPYELTYGIWYRENNTSFDPTSTRADVTTQKGALSYSLTGLKPETQYGIVVRASDTVNYSESVTPKAVTTATATESDYGTLQKMALPNTPRGMVVRTVPDQETRQLGIYTAEKLVFYSLSGSQLTGSTEIGVADILEAHMAETRSILGDDAFILTADRLALYLAGTGTTTGFTLSTASFAPVPEPGTLSFTYVGRVIDTVSYVGSDHTGYIYAYDGTDEERDNQGFGTASTYALGGAGTFRLGDFDGDGRYDLVSLVGDDLAVALGGDEDFSFEAAETLETLDESYFAGANTKTVWLYLHDRDGDGKLDILLFVRNAQDNITKLLIYNGMDGGAFGTRSEVDFNMAFLQDPRFVDFDGSGGLDLAVRQTRSNNIAVYKAPSYSKSTPALFGIEPDDSTTIGPEFFALANFNSDSGKDVMMSRGKNLYFLLSK